MIVIVLRFNDWCPAGKYGVDGEVRVAIQRCRSRFLGIAAEVTADGFVIAPDGVSRPLNQQYLGSYLVS
jgi:hypothetical protein